MAADAGATVAALDRARAVFRRQIEASGGRVIDMAGDSVLAVFDTAAGAVDAALTVQKSLEAASASLTEERRMRVRIGVHLGDVIEKPDGTVYGDGVNIAARLQSLAAPGGITISEAVHGTVKNAAMYDDQGSHKVKNIAEPIHAFAVRIGSASRARPAHRRGLAVALAASVVIVLAGTLAWQQPRSRLS